MDKKTEKYIFYGKIAITLYILFIVLLFATACEKKNKETKEEPQPITTQEEPTMQEEYPLMPKVLVGIGVPRETEEPSETEMKDGHKTEIPPQEEQEPTPPQIEIPLSEKIKKHIYEICNYDSDLYCFVISVIEQESRFNVDAVSEDGHDHGLMQLRDTYHGEVKEPIENVSIGTSVLFEFLEKYEYKNLALMCYNMGETGAKRLWNKGTYSTDYTVKVLNNYKSYVKELEGV